jgi:hypothetical protein
MPQGNYQFGFFASPPAALETQRAQSRFFFSLSVERTESEKQQPFGKNIIK